MIVIDRHNHHCFQPLLYQVATAALSPADIAWPIRHILRPQRNATVLMEEVQGIDPEKKVLHTQYGDIAYDYLVIATGATHSYFGHDEWSKFAPGLKRIEDATRIRRSILIAFERAELTQDPDQQRRLLTFVIVGGGATGVEMARCCGADACRGFSPHRSALLAHRAGRGRTTVAANLPPSLSDYALRTLTRSGVEVQTDTLVTNCDANGVELENGRIDAGTVIWAAGVTASPAVRWLEADRAGRVKVGPDLSVPGIRRFSSSAIRRRLLTARGSQCGIAPAAKQMGKHVGKLISARIAGRELQKPFRYMHLGELATIGRRAAVVKFGALELKGFLGWLFWSLAHIYFLIGLRNRFVVAFNWFWDYITFQRGARLITDVPEGK